MRATHTNFWATVRAMSEFLPYDPGVLPTRQPPAAGESVAFEVAGLPPYKDLSHSIRNISHPRYQSFVDLRKAGTAAMEGRAWYGRPIKLCVEIRANELHERRGLIEYVNGISDTLDGSHGFTFTYLPIAFEDDCQIAEGEYRIVPADEPSYRVEITFLDPEDCGE